MKEIKNVYVICCNDSLEFALIGNTNIANIAQEKLNKLKDAYYKSNKHSFESYASYETRCYWHIHTLPGLIEESEELIKTKDLLHQAIKHLDYCGYGDKWERECAEELQKELNKWYEEN